MNELNEQYAYFTIVNGFDPKEITQRLGVDPTDSWRRGDINPRNNLHRKFSKWSLCSSLSRDQRLEAHIRNVLAQLDQRADMFRQVSIEFGGTMQLVGYFRTQYPGLHFEPDILTGLAKFCLAVDFDFYF